MAKPHQSHATAMAAQYFRDEQQRLYPRSLHARYYKLAAEAIERVARLEAELTAAKEQLEWDRTQCADFLTKLHKCMDSRFWLTEGRGSYAWDDDRYREEFKEAATELLAALRPLREMAANMASSPKTNAEVVQARIDLKKRITDLEAELAAAREDRERLDWLAKASNVTAKEVSAIVNGFRFRRKYYGNIRAAIDAAREGETDAGARAGR